MMKLKINSDKLYTYGLVVLANFIILSYIADFATGKEVAQNLWHFIFSMIKIFPCAFILIGLFEVWIKKETVEKHLGHGSSPVSYVWALVLAATTVGGLFVGFPVAYTLFKKGARLSVIFTYIGAAAVCRVPMTIFEASYMGIKFSIIRFTVSLPLIVLTSILLERILKNVNYEITEPK